MIDNDTFQQIFEHATPVQKFLITSSESGGSLFALAQKHQLTNPETYNKFAITVGDIVLGFYKVADTVPLLQQELNIDARAAALLGADVLDFLSPLSDKDFVVKIDSLSDDTFLVPAPQSETAIQHPIGSAPATPTNAPELHTMAMDAHAARENYQPAAEPVYSSEQPALRPPLSDLPSYTSGATTPQNSTPLPPIEPPRWGV